MAFNVEQLRNLTGVLNRYKGVSSEEIYRVTRMFSPPFKGEQMRPAISFYPDQLSGLHNAKDRQRINVSGNTGSSSFGDTSGAYGIPTGGSYAV